MTDTPDEAAPEEDRVEENPAAERDRLRDRLLRTTAEYDNYRKRVGREQADWAARAIERLVLDLLPGVDSFDRALQVQGGAKEDSPLLEGMILVHKQLLGALKAHGVEPFESLGCAFDPNLHDAFMSRPAAPGEEPGTIVEEFMRGYRMGARTIRPAKGVVAAASAEDAGTGAQEEE